MKNSIIVPIDFTDVSHFAMEHAYLIAKKIKTPITLVHIVNKSNLIDEKEKELKQLAEKFKKSHTDIEISTIVRKGNIFKTIYEVAQELDAYLAIMGTHGQKTLKKAMKVVKKFVKIAFVLVQASPEGKELKKILIPLDNNPKTRANLNWIRIFGRYFNLNVYLLYPLFKSDEKNRLTTRNLRFAEKILDNELIDYQVVRANQTDNYPSEIFVQIKELDADMLTIMLSNYKNIIPKLKTDEELETYKNTPILCVNPRIDLKKAGGLT
ncbi:MAG: universal stress protein [Bacteroidota bacterium]|nr:universal stress protein [Bacteroidota bacterium]